MVYYDRGDITETKVCFGPPGPSGVAPALVGGFNSSTRAPNVVGVSPAELRSSFVGHVPDHFLLADADETPARKARRLLWPARGALRAERLIVDSDPPG